MDKKTYIVTISDTHTRHKELTVPKGDIIIHAGDFSYRGTKQEIEDFVYWYASLDHAWKIVIAGNHDKGTDPARTEQQYKGLDKYFRDLCALENIYVLEDDFIEVWTNDGEIIKIWGSPVSPTFGYGWAWNRDRGQKIKKHWDKIPEDVDIVVTHGPPFGFGDRVAYSPMSSMNMVGCQDLMDRLKVVKPKMTIFGHIHEDRGVFIDDENEITHVNTSSLTLKYQPYPGRSYRFDWDKVKQQKSLGLDYD